MSGPRLFLVSCSGAFIAALAVLLIIRAVPLPSSVLINTVHGGAVDRLPPDEITALKVRVARERPRFDVGLFGNSRVLMVGADELNAGREQTFNFAIGGHSVRQSIRLLGELALIGKAPRLALISMDHPELGLPGGSGVYPPPPRRWYLRAIDITNVRREWGWKAAGVALANSIAIEYSTFALTFNRVYVQNKISALWEPSSIRGAYRPDGSRVESQPTRHTELELPRPRADFYPELESDFSRIAAMRRDGVRVIVYESPLEPTILDQVESRLSANARDVRRRFLTVCERFGLECYTSPRLIGGHWSDATHAPAQLLADWLRKRTGPL
jgi:hypothetical protein